MPRPSLGAQSLLVLSCCGSNVICSSHIKLVKGVHDECINSPWIYPCLYMSERLTLIFLTHICPVDYSILINWSSPFPILGVAGVIFHFYLIFDRNSYKQTVKTLIRRLVLRRVICVCTVCLCPKNGTLGLYGLNHSFKMIFCHF